MADKTHIEWTRGDDGEPGATWNPLVGCQHVSPGCDHCYAARMASGRLSRTSTYGGLAENGVFTGEVRLLPDRLTQPLRWRKPKRIFVNSMSDLFHDAVPDEYIAQVFAVMAVAPHHVFQVLTKRHGRMRSVVSSEPFWQHVLHYVKAIRQERRTPSPLYVDGGGLPQVLRPLPNVWLGVSVEDQRWADIRMPALLDTPAAVRFLSCEPLLGPIDLSMVDSDGVTGLCVLEKAPHGIDWVIIGGESGPDARPMHPGWARGVRDQCVAAGVPFHYKQSGEWAPVPPYTHYVTIDGGLHTIDGASGGIGRLDPVAVRRVGKKAAGRELDGREWNEYPARVDAPA